MDNYKLLFPNVVTFTCDPHSPPSLCHVYISSNTNMYVRAPFNVITQSTHLRSRIVWRCSVLYTIHLSQLAMSEGLLILSLEPRLSVPDFVSQLWRKIGFFSKAGRQNPERRAWVRGKLILALIPLYPTRLHPSASWSHLRSMCPVCTTKCYL